MLLARALLQVKYAFHSPVWQKADIQLFRLNHCWRYDVDSRLGKFLAELRVSEHFNKFLFAQLSELFLGSDECECEMFLACRKFQARSHCLGS